MDEENLGNGRSGLLWFIAIVNLLTLILLVVFFVMSWDVITAKNPQQGIQQIFKQQPLQQDDCVPTCIEGGKTPQECIQGCGI